jgi:replicative DNA helicase
VLGGRSGMGKTAILTELFKAGGRVVSDRTTRYLFCTWEMGPDEVVDRQICNQAGVTYRMLTQGAKLLDGQTYQRILGSYERASKLPITYQMNSTNIKEVQAMIIEFVKQCREEEADIGTEIQPVIVIDYLGMAQFEGSGLRTYGIGEFMNGLKKIANETGSHIVVLTQLKRESDDKDMPGRSDFADSAAIEMASDNLLILHRPEYQQVPTIVDPVTGASVSSEGKGLIRVLKCRAMGTGDFLINIEMKYFRFWDIDHPHDFEYWNLYGDENFWKKTYGLI